MLNIHELEKRHFNYKLKSYVPYLIILLSITIIIGIIVMVIKLDIFSIDEKKSILKLDNTPSNLIEKVDIAKNTVTNKIETKPEKIIQKKEIIIQELNNTIVLSNNTVTEKIEGNESEFTNQKLVLSPSMNFIKNINASSLNSFTYKEPEEKVEYKQQDKAKIVQKPKPQYSRQPLTNEQENFIQIKKNDTYDDIYHVIKRFNKNNNPALSLFIAKKYYELGEYKKSYNYALRTNEINNNIEASWIIFAKSLVKLNKKGMAIKTLQKYINHSNSNKAKILLDEISSGKLNAD